MGYLQCMVGTLGSFSHLSTVRKEEGEEGKKGGGGSV